MEKKKATPSKKKSTTVKRKRTQTKVKRTTPTTKRTKAKKKPIAKQVPKENITLFPEAEEAPKPSFEELLLIFWGKNKQKIYGVIFILLLAFVSGQGIKFYKHYKVEQIKSIFAKAKNIEEQLQFAYNNEKMKLAGYVFLKKADEEYKKNNYKEAEQFYNHVLKSSAKTPVIGARAKLGYAVCKIKQNDNKCGETVLKTIAFDKKNLKNFRVQSLYFLALTSFDEKDYKACNGYIEEMNTLENKGFYSMKAASLGKKASLLIEN